MKSSKVSDVEGGAPVCVKYTVAGQLGREDFVQFVVERARWFDLDGWIAVEGAEVTVVVTGPEAMVGALEMAMTLGPLTSLVDRLDRTEEGGPVTPGFQVLQK